MADREFDRLVEEVAKQVRARLGADSVAPRPLGLPVLADGGVCMATKDNCVGDGGCVVKKSPVIDAMIERGATRFSAAAGQVSGVESRVAAMIDHTLLKPEATESDVRKVCEEARKHKFATVCLNSSWIPLASRLLAGSGVKPIAVVGFPLGVATTSAKAFETREAVRNGAGEVDMVINVGALKSGMLETVETDIREVVRAAGPGIVTKVILETSLLTDTEKIKACELSKKAGADFVKTSTGFGPGGATAADIALMRRVVGAEMGVKASGGIRDRETALLMVQSGASRIGASASVKIVEPDPKVKAGGAKAAEPAAAGKY